MGPMLNMTTNLVPSADDATPPLVWNGSLRGVHVIPESTEVLMTPLARPTSFLPSDEDASALQRSGYPRSVQVTLESVEVLTVPKLAFECRPPKVQAIRSSWTAASTES